MKIRLWSPRERATEKLTTKEVNFSWESVQPRLRQRLYEKGHQDFFSTLFVQSLEKNIIFPGLCFILDNTF